MNIKNYLIEQFQNQKINAPTYAYHTVYGKYPNQFLNGRSSAAKKNWNGMDVDADLKDEWLEAINNLSVEIRSTDAGKDATRVAFVIFRMPQGEDNMANQMSSMLNKPKYNYYSASNIGQQGRPRIIVAGKIWKGMPNWERWWNDITNLIDTAYSSVKKINRV